MWGLSVKASNPQALDGPSQLAVSQGIHHHNDIESVALRSDASEGNENSLGISPAQSPRVDLSRRVSPPWTPCGVRQRPVTAECWHCLPVCHSPHDAPETHTTQQRRPTHHVRRHPIPGDWTHEGCCSSHQCETLRALGDVVWMTLQLWLFGDLTTWLTVG